MISDSARYYGCVFTYLVDNAGAAIKLWKLDTSSQGFYLANDKLPLYVKFCRNRKGPWTFNFQRDHQLQIKELVANYGDCIVVLVCGKDGLVALAYAQLREVLDDEFDAQEAVTVRRKLRQMYSVQGSDGRLARKVSQDSLAEALSRCFNCVQST